jgi:hypothetical protein
MRLHLLAIVLAGCGSSSDGGGGDDSPTPDAHAQAAHHGAVTLTTYAAMSQGTPFQGGGATARFWTDACASEVQGECTIGSCTTATWQSAGVITVATTAGSIQIDPGADNSYPTKASQAPLYTPGETITISALGATVPAFNGTLVAPGKPTLTSPLAQQGMLVIDRSHDFAFAWTGGGSQDVWMTISGGNYMKWIACRYPASAGHATIPKAVLATLPAGAGSFGLSGLSTVTRDTGPEWDVTLQAFYSAIWPDNTLASGQTTLQ